MSLSEVIAQKITDHNVAMVSKHNTIYTAADHYGMESSIVRKAILGLANEMSADINLYRNTILPVVSDFELAVKAKAKTSITTIADKVSLHVLTYQDGLDLMTSLGLVDPKTVATYQDLPSNPLVIEYDKDLVSASMSTSNNQLNTHINEIIMEHEADYVEDVHTAMFDNVSKTNSYIMELAYSPLRNYHKMIIALALVVGYINNDIGVANMAANKARTDYLYTLRAIISTGLSRYVTDYKRALESEALIVSIDRSDEIQVYLIGEIYDKYLDQHNVEPIIGYSSNEDNPSRVRLDNFLVSIDVYQSYYNEAVRLATIKSSINNINTLKLAYKLAAREYLNDMSDDQLEMYSLNKDSIPAINTIVEEYVNGLDNTELLEVTEISRAIVGNIIFGRPDFIKFVGYMNHYTKIFPDLNVDEIATSALAASIIDKLEEQLVVQRVK